MRGRLGPRLRAVAQAVREGAVAADVGTDHGQLICALVEEGRCPRGFASDINPGPLAAAERTVCAAGLSNKIELLLSDGLRGLPGGEIDDVVIAGMGGELIAEILTAVDWTRNADKRYILQPMTRAEELRRRLCAEGFALQDEVAVEEGRFVYTVITAGYTGERRAVDDLFALTGLLPGRREPETLVYLGRLRRRLEEQAAGLARAKNEQNTAQLQRLQALAAGILEMERRMAT